MYDKKKKYAIVLTKVNFYNMARLESPVKNYFTKNLHISKIMCTFVKNNNMNFATLFINSIKFNDFKVMNAIGKTYVITMLISSLLTYIGLIAIQI